MEITRSQHLFELIQIPVNKQYIARSINYFWGRQHEAQIGKRGKAEDVLPVFNRGTNFNQVFDVAENTLGEEDGRALQSYALVLTAVLKHCVDINKLVCHIVKLHVLKALNVL